MTRRSIKNKDGMNLGRCSMAYIILIKYIFSFKFFTFLIKYFYKVAFFFSDASWYRIEFNIK